VEAWKENGSEQDIHQHEKRRISAGDLWFLYHREKKKTDIVYGKNYGQTVGRNLPQKAGQRWPAGGKSRCKARRKQDIKAEDRQ